MTFTTDYQNSPFDMSQLRVNCPMRGRGDLDDATGSTTAIDGWEKRWAEGRRIDRIDREGVRKEGIRGLRGW